MATLKNTTVSDTGAIQLPVGTTAQRPVSPSVGQMRYNSTFKTVESYDGTRWRYMPDIVRGGLVLHLDAGEPSSYSGSGTTWTDLSGNGRNATINGSPTFTNGYFDITSDSTYISLSNSGLVPRTNDFTYSCWVNFDSFDSLDTIFENGYWTDTLLFRHQNNTGIDVYAEAAYIGTFSWVATAGVWYNIVFKRENNIASCFINNSLTGIPFTMNVDINLADTQLWLMRSRHTTNQFTDGKISFFSIYSRALTGREIKQNYEAMRGRFGL